MTTTDYSALDRPEISMNSFYPRRNWTPTPSGAQDFAVTVADDISLSCRFFPVGRGQPTILFFYGNGETAADYDNIAPVYNQVGVNFFVADYRGYGNSGGLPTFSSMLADAHQVREEVGRILEAGQFTGDLYVMGRSMGRHAAFELATSSPEGALKGVIIESGRHPRQLLPRGGPGHGESAGSRLSGKGGLHQHAGPGNPRGNGHPGAGGAGPGDVRQLRFPAEEHPHHPRGRPQRPALPGHQRILHSGKGLCGSLAGR